MPDYGRANRKGSGSQVAIIKDIIVVLCIQATVCIWQTVSWNSSSKMPLDLVWMGGFEMGRGPSQTFLDSFQDRNGLNRLPCILSPAKQRSDP